jgi:putative inorganic carbon (hco3(-)) transporter
MPLRSLFFLVAFAGCTASSLLNPMIGVLTYVALYHIFPETTWWGKCLGPLGLRYSFITGICVLVGSVLHAGRLKFGRHFLHPVEWGILLLFLAMIVSTTAGGVWNAKATLLLDKMFKVVLFALLLSHITVTKQRLWQLTVLLTVMTLYLGHEATNAPPGAFTQNRLDGIGGPDFRESTGLAIHLLALLPFVAVVFRQRSWPLKLLAFLAGGYGVNAILLCRARSAFIGAVVAGLLAIWYAPRRYRGWIVGVLMVGALGVVKLSDSWFWTRMATVFTSADERDSSAANRLEIWSAAYQMVKANPMGVGMRQFRPRIGEYGIPGVSGRDAHNTYILCAGELGLLGLLAYVGSLLAAWLALSMANRRIKRELADRQLLELLVFANRLAIVVYAVSGLFVSRLYVEGVWWFILLPACITRAVENEVRAQVPAGVCVEKFVPAELPPGLGALPA